MAHIPPSHDDHGTPNYVPLVGFDENDEPFIVRTQVIRPSPIPRSISVLIILMMALGVANIVYFSTKRTSDLRCETTRDRALAAALQRRVDVAERDRAALRTMVVAVAQAHTGKQVSVALDTFIQAEAIIDKAEQDERATSQRLLAARCDTTKGGSQ